MATIPRIWFLRHGQTEWNLQRRLQGGLDSPLTPLGRSQAEAQARVLAPVLADVVQGPGDLFASPLGRAQETARIALAGHPFVTDARLAEIGTGAWEGRLRDEVTAGLDADQGDLMLYASAPGGEGLERLEARVADFLNDLTGPSIVVAHGLLGKVLRGQVRGLNRVETGRLDNLQGCVYLLENGTETCLFPEGAQR